MSMFENDQYRWRETYFVLFHSSKAPPAKKLKETISSLNARYTLTNLHSDSKGKLESLTILAPDDFAALDICYVEGDEVQEQVDALADELKGIENRPEDRARIERIRKCDARFDVLHFEQLSGVDDADELDEMLDPSALLVVLEALAKLTDGIPVDPQSGALL
ncbi:MAG: hypothetical protein HUU20_13285 [Pirellulales bacterium]|nr:hypothetical protein [Pirellulales bacterium]